MDDIGLDEKYFQEYSTKGFTVIPNFLTPQEVSELKSATNGLIEKYCTNTKLAKFSATGSEDSFQTRDEYFVDSADKIRGFLEELDVPTDETGNPKVPVSKFLNKIGHALHKFDPTFHACTFSDKVKYVIQKCGTIKKPVVFQSMVIFKSPKVGGVVTNHQDATYLYAEPKEGSVVGFWIALDEATEENGCLQFWPGSHRKGNLYKRFKRNPDKSSDQLFIFEGDEVPQIPKDECVSALAKPGTLVLIDGLVIHQSASNRSTNPRLAYTFHVIDGARKYSEDNWIQPTDAGTFMELLP